MHSAFVPHDIAKPIAGASHGPLAGLTVAIKDMYDIAGERTGGGNPDWLEAHPPASQTAGAVQKLLNAGATVIGRTICDEFFYSVAGANAHYGTPVNPRAPDRLPGGSSSGSAVATAAGACDFALGSDTGGSVRIPAAFCGLYGIRPTHGRVDLSGVMAMAPSFDVPGWFANGPGVFHRVGAVLLQGASAYRPIEELIVLDDAFAQADPAIADLLHPSLETLRKIFPKLTHASIADGQLDAWRESFRIVQARETWQTYGGFIKAHHPRLGPGIKERMEFASSVSEHQAEAARREQKAAREIIRRSATTRVDIAAADSTLHRAAQELDAIRSGAFPRSRHAADLHCGARRSAAGDGSGRHARGRACRSVVHRLGGQRRGPSRARPFPRPPCRFQL